MKLSLPLLLLSTPALCVAAGSFSTAGLTGDGDSGISSAKAYTHAIDMGDGGNRTVNGVVFTGSGGGANPATNTYTTTGITDLLPGWANPNVSGATGGLFTNFNYQGAGGTETVTLRNLRVGQQYERCFTTRCGAGRGVRRSRRATAGALSLTRMRSRGVC